MLVGYVGRRSHCFQPSFPIISTVQCILAYPAVRKDNLKASVGRASYTSSSHDWGGASSF